MLGEKKDLSMRCDKDDENLKNNCLSCSYFCFPIGCMFYEGTENTENTETAEK